MNIRRTYIILLLAIVVISGCRRTGGGEITELPPVTPSFLYANDDGQLRILNVDFTDDLDTLFSVSRFTTLGQGNFEFGKVDVRKGGTYDWGVFAPEREPRGVAVTWRENTLRPTHKTEWERLYVEIGNFERLRLMGFYSEVNQRRQDLRQYNYYRGANSVGFIDNRYYVALYTDRYDRESGAPRPNLPVSHRKTSLLLYDLQAPQPNQPEIIATLFHDDYMSRFPSTYNWIHNIRGARVAGSPNAEFFYIWTKAFNTWGSYPWVFRFDGTPAYNPVPLGSQQYSRVPAQEAFALDIHPRRDSLLVVSDRHPQYEGTFVLKVPDAERTPFTILAELPFEESIPETGSVSVGNARQDNSWYVKFNQAGNKVAIISATDGVPPHVTIWNWQDGTHRRYLINSNASQYDFTEVSEPGWVLHGDDDILVFLAGDPTSDISFFHYVDASDENQTHAQRINWDDIEFRDMPTEPPLRAVKEIKQRKPY